jgi:hypothetical protein
VNLKAIKNVKIFRILNENQRTELDDAIITCSKGDSFDFFKFAATHVATLGNGQTEQSFVGDCFATTKMTYSKIDASTVQVEIDAQDATSDLCSVKKCFTESRLLKLAL